MYLSNVKCWYYGLLCISYNCISQHTRVGSWAIVKHSLFYERWSYFSFFFLQSCGLLLSHLSLPFFRKCSSLMNFNNQRIIIDGFWWLISVELTKQVERINTQIHWCCLFKLLTFQLIYFSEYFYLLEHVGLTFFFSPVIAVSKEQRNVSYRIGCWFTDNS